jgi:hypothetical protein
LRSLTLAIALLLSIVSANAADPAAAAAPPAQTEADEYTRYELLAPESAQFRIVFDVTATAAGAKFYFNPIRRGSEASRESVADRMTGEALKFEVVGAEDARRTGLPDAQADMQYIRVTLPRPVPGGGQVRLRIDKTYKDAGSWFREGRDVVFKRPLGIKRNTIVLPAGYELVFCNVPSQVLTESDGRLAVSFVNSGPEAAPLVIRARKVAP